MWKEIKDTPLKFKAFMTTLLMSIVVVAITACTAPTEEEVVKSNSDEARLVAVVDGCRLWRVDDRYGDKPYFARCPEGAATTFEEHRSGKHSTKTTSTIGEN